MKTKIYLSGPMTGYPNFNREAFYAAEELLSPRYDVVSPARIRVNPVDNAEPLWSDWMRAAIREMMDASAVALLPGWGKSTGAQVEYTLAINLGILVRPLSEWLEGHTLDLTNRQPYAMLDLQTAKQEGKQCQK